MEIVAIVKSQKYRRQLWGYALLLVCGVTGVARADVGAADAPKPAARSRAPLAPNWELVVKDATLIQQLMDKNKWYQEFHQSMLYQGLVQKMSPILFSNSDEYGVGAKGWKGRLLDHVYSKVMAGHPLVISYFNRRDYSSPFTISVQDISGTEKSAVAALVEIFRTTEDQKVDVGSLKGVPVTPLLIRGQRFALSISDRCLSIGRDAFLTALAGSRCKGAILEKGEDGRLSVSLAQQFPAFNGLRERFFSTEEESRIHLKWNSSEARFEAIDAVIGLKDAQAPILKGKWGTSLLKALPASAIFYSTVQVPSFDGYSQEGLTKYLKSDLSSLRKRKATPMTLFYAPVLAAESEGGEEQAVREEEEKEQRSSRGASLSAKLSLATGLLLPMIGKNDKLMADLTHLLSGTKKGEVFFRPVCGDSVVLSNRLELVQLVEKVCSKKAPSMNEMGAKWVSDLGSSDFSAAAYFSPGKMLSRYMQIGWDNRKIGKKEVAVAFPEELVKAQKLVESLSDQVFFGSVDGKKIVLKAVR